VALYKKMDGADQKKVVKLWSDILKRAEIQTDLSRKDTLGGAGPSHVSGTLGAAQVQSPPLQSQISFEVMEAPERFVAINHMIKKFEGWRQIPTRVVVELEYCEYRVAYAAILWQKGQRHGIMIRLANVWRDLVRLGKGIPSSVSLSSQPGGAGSSRTARRPR